MAGRRRIAIGVLGLLAGACFSVNNVHVDGDDAGAGGGGTGGAAAGAGGVAAGGAGGRSGGGGVSGSGGGAARGSGGASGAGGTAAAGGRSGSGGAPAGSGGGTGPAGSGGRSGSGGAGGPAVSFFDDFEDGDLMGWVSSAIGSSTAFTNVVDGTTRVLEAVNPAGDDPLFAAGNVGWTDQAVEARVKLTAGSATVARIFLCARLRDLDNYYFLYLEDDEIIVRRMQSGSSTTLTRVQVPGGTVALGTWYRLRLVVQGSTVTGFVDGTATPSYVDAVPITNGGIAVGVSEEATAHFDDVRVTPPP